MPSYSAEIVTYGSINVPTALPPLTPQSAPRGELELQHFGTLSGALAYKKNEHATGAADHLRCNGRSGVTLSDEPQLLHVLLVRRNGMPALRVMLR